LGAQSFIETEAAGKRAGKRSRVLLAARLRTPSGEIDARLRDLSAKGALVECEATPPVDDAVVFVRGEIEVPARIAWVGAGRIGLEFDAEIDAQDILVQLGKGGPAEDPYRYVKLPHRLTGDQRRLALAWGVTVGLSAPGGGSRRK
jgi:hypothetical protein